MILNHVKLVLWSCCLFSILFFIFIYSRNLTKRRKAKSNEYQNMHASIHPLFSCTTRSNN